MLCSAIIVSIERRHFSCSSFIFTFTSLARALTSYTLEAPVFYHSFYYFFLFLYQCLGPGSYPPGTDPQQIKDQMQMNRDNTVVVLTEGKLTLKFSYDDLLRIKSWHFTTISHQELIPRNLIALIAQQDQSQLEQLSKNITRQGFTSTTLNYLRVSH